MKARCTAARRHVARAVLGVVASWRLATGQGSGWVATPSSPTVGDTIWLERTITVPAGWRGRAGKLELAADVEPLGDPPGLRRPTRRVGRHPLGAGAPGPPRLRPPPDLAPGAGPAAHRALSPAECLAAVERARPDMPLRELRDLLEQLDRVAFASAHGTDIAALATMARRLAREIGGRRSVP